MSKITLKYSGKEYTLEYSRQSVKMIESQGFVAEQLSAKPMTMIPILFQGAFLKNHKMKRSLMDEIYDSIPDKGAFISALAEMYSETVGALVEDKEDEGNVSWAVVK